MSSQTTAEPAAEPRRRPSRLVWVAVVVAIVVAVGLVVRQLTHDEKPPYTDPASSGLLTLCDTRGHEITSGKITDKPLAPIVLGSTALDSRVEAGVQGLATLYGYQPRAGVEAEEFSGSPIGGPVPFKDHTRPATRVVKAGYSIKDFTTIYPANDDGFVQLRLILSADGLGVDTDSYDTADLKVTGDTWHVVRGGNASCSDAAARLAD